MIKCVSIYIGTMPVAVGQVRYSMVEVWYGRMVGPYFVFCIFKYVFCGVGNRCPVKSSQATLLIH